jgi:hypothetical protein
MATQSTRELAQTFLSRQRKLIAPNWLLLSGALLLLAGSFFPWMRFFEPPLTATSAVVARAGGARSEPEWIILNLALISAALIDRPFR